MAQKKFPVLHKVDTSMAWYSTIFNKNYRWLSNNYLFILQLLFKAKILINDLDYFFNDIQNKKFNNIYKFQFKYDITIDDYLSIGTYLLDLEYFILVLNLYLQNDFLFLFKKKVINKKILNNIYIQQKMLDKKLNNFTKGSNIFSEFNIFRESNNRLYLNKNTCNNSKILKVKNLNVKIKENNLYEEKQEFYQPNMLIFWLLQK